MCQFDFWQCNHSSKVLALVLPSIIVITRSSTPVLRKGQCILLLGKFSRCGNSDNILFISSERLGVFRSNSESFNIIILTVLCLIFEWFMSLYKSHLLLTNLLTWYKVGLYTGGCLSINKVCQHSINSVTRFFLKTYAGL